MKAGGTDAGIRLLQPMLWPFIWAHALTGFVVAVGPMVREASLPLWLQGIAGSGIWAVLFVAPAIGLMRVFDDDQSSKLTSTAWISLVMVLVGLTGSMVIGWRFFEAALVSIIVIVLHVAPPVRLARFSLGELLVEAAGIGAMSFLAGFFSAGAVAPVLKLCLYALGFLILFLVMRGLLLQEGLLAAPWIGYFGMASGFAGLVLPMALEHVGWKMLLPLVAAPLWIGAGLRRNSGLAVASISPATGMGIWLATDLAVVLTIFLS